MVYGFAHPNIATVSFIIVGLMLILMMTGMPLGVVTLFVSVLSALCYFGYGGLYLVSTNAFGLLEKYPLIAVPLFVFTRCETIMIIAIVPAPETAKAKPK